MMIKDERHELRRFAGTIRKEIVAMIGRAGTGHPGGSLSVVDILTVLYRRVMRHDPANPGWRDRDRFVLSKGHAAPALYATLAHCGYFPLETLLHFREFGGMLQGHPDCRKTPGVEISTGSLGQGLSIAGGMALAAKILGLPWRTYVLLGDGEIQEGQVWEAAMAIGHYGLGNLTAIVDNNGLQIDGRVEKVMNVYPIGDKFASFGWNAVEIDGHDLEEIEEAILRGQGGSKPTALIARTIKGKGVSFMEDRVEYHHTKDLPAELVRKALQEIDAGLEGVS